MQGIKASLVLFSLPIIFCGILRANGTCLNQSLQENDHPRPACSSSNRTARDLLRLIKSKTFGYERNTRPTFLKKPTEVYIFLVIVKITVRNGLFDVDLVLHQRWNDPRLIHTPSSNYCQPGIKHISLQEEYMTSIWTPDTFFEREAYTEKHKGIKPTQSVHIFCDGSVESRIRLTTTVYCTMYFTAFPHDNHDCAFMISSWAYKTDALVFHWDPEGTDDLGESLDSNNLGDFQLTNITQFKTESDIPHSGKYSRITIQFGFKRKPNYFIFNFYFPANLVVVASWISFWIEAKSTSARVQLGIATVLTTLTLMVKTLDSSKIPDVSALKAMDVYMIMCFVYTFIALMVYPFVHSMIKHERTKKDAWMDNPPVDRRSFWDSTGPFGPSSSGTYNPKREGKKYKKKIVSSQKVIIFIDRHSRWVFPVSFLICNVIYFAIILYI